MKINNSAAAAAAPAFVAAVSAAAAKADNANLAAACAVLIIIRNSGGTNKKAASALWALLPESVTQTFAQVKRINGAINAPAEKASEGASTIRPLWLAAKTGKAFTEALLDIGIKSPRALLDFVAPRGDKKDTMKKGAVETFMQAAKADGFKEDVTALIVWVAEKHAKQMAQILAEADAERASKHAEAEAKQAEEEAKQAEKEKKLAAKRQSDAERTRKRAEALAEADKKASEEKSAQAKRENTAKVERDRATHPKVRDIIEA